MPGCGGDLTRLGPLAKFALYRNDDDNAVERVTGIEPASSNLEGLVAPAAYALFNAISDERRAFRVPYRCAIRWTSCRRRFIRWSSSQSRRPRVRCTTWWKTCVEKRSTRQVTVAGIFSAAGSALIGPHEVTSVTEGRVAADKADMTSSVADVSEAEFPPEWRATEAPCLVCVTTSSLDDDQPKTGMVRWKVVANFRLKTGIAVSFECPQGHSSEDDPELLKGFPPRRFW